ncbi:MAG: hypothetical protein AAGB93_13305 [Planctomycetota bacterium]
MVPRVLLVALAVLLAPRGVAQDAVRVPPTAGAEPLGPARSAVQTPRGDLLVLLATGRVEFLDAGSGASLATLRPDGAAHGGVAVSRDFSRIALRDADDRVRVVPLGLEGTTDPAGIDWTERRPDVAFVAHRSDRWSPSVLQWTGDGEHLVTWGEQSYHQPPTTPPQIWTADGELVWTGPAACDASLHATEDRLAFVRADEVSIGWPGSGFESIELPGAFGGIEHDPSGERIAVGGRSAVIGGEEGHGLLDRHTGRPTLRILDGGTGRVTLEVDLSEVGVLGLANWLHRLSWSPDGRHVGVSVGKGHNPGVASIEDGSIVLQVPSGSGQMWRTFPVGWAGNDLFLPGAWIDGLVPIDAPEERVEGFLCGGAKGLALRGSSHVLLLLDDGLARFDPAAREVVWKR